MKKNTKVLSAFVAAAFIFSAAPASASTWDDVSEWLNVTYSAITKIIQVD